jgi:hypothetical protein
MTQIHNFTWEQGADLPIKMVYKEGETVATAVPIDLSSNYSVRMDIVLVNSQGIKERLYTFNSEEIPDVDEADGDQPDGAPFESTLSSGAGGTPNIAIKVPRSITLPPDGKLYLKMIGPNRTNLFQFDIFLRNKTTDTQVKVLEGTITVKESFTLWA